MRAKKYTILITGGGTGIGASLATDLGANGNKVIICGRRAEKLEAVTKQNENICGFKCDVSKEAEVVLFKRHVSERFLCIDVLINAAGLFGSIGRFDKTDSKQWRETIDVNLFGTYLITKHFLDLLLKSEVKKIINMSGGGAFNSFPNYSAYAVSKAAVVRFTENIAEELAELGVQVNCVAPGFVATEIHKATIDADKDRVGNNFYEFTLNKLREGAVPMDVVVNCVKFLISPHSNGLSGKTISASFDKWDSEEFRNSIDKISKSELFTMKRINLRNLDEKDELRGKLGK